MSGPASQSVPDSAVAGLSGSEQQPKVDDPEKTCQPRIQFRASQTMACDRCGLANGVCCVLTSTNFALAQSNCTRLMTNTFDGSGNFIFANPGAPNAGGRFYRLQLP